MSRGIVGVLCSLLLVLTSCGGGQAPDVGKLLPTEEGHFLVRAESRVNPIPLHVLHTWVVHVENRDGTPVEQATILVEGGMPAHQHGLPTRPRMTLSLGDGDFLIEGMKFSMGGHWTLTFSIRADGKEDRVTLDLQT